MVAQERLFLVRADKLFQFPYYLCCKICVVRFRLMVSWNIPFLSPPVIRRMQGQTHLVLADEAFAYKGQGLTQSTAVACGEELV